MSRALRKRFGAITRAEIARLEKKLRGLSDEERRSVEALTVDIIEAIACVPEQALISETPEPALAAVVELFQLEGEVVSR